MSYQQRQGSYAIETTDGEEATGLFYGVSFWVDGQCLRFYANGGHYGMYD